MRVAPTVVACVTALPLAPALSAEWAGADTPRVALSVSPAQLVLTPPTSRKITLRNDGAERVVVDAMRRALGRQTASKRWLRVTPQRLTLRPGTNAVLTLRASRSRDAEPGEHPLIVFLTTRPVRGDRVNVQARLGVRIKMRVPGRVVRRLVLGRLRIRRAVSARSLLVSVANRGNVSIPLRGRISASLFKRGKKRARLTPRARRVLRPRTRTVVELRYRGRLRGHVIAVLRVRLGPAAPTMERRYQLRL